MRPRKPTQADCDFWSQNGKPAAIGPMKGSHIGAADIQVIHHDGYVRVPWVPDDRDAGSTLSVTETVWTSFLGGMLATDVVIH